MLFVALCIAVFAASVAIDFVEAYYVRSVADSRAHNAGVYSVLMYCIGCVGFFAVLEYSWWLMVPECLGLYLGSRLAIARQTRDRESTPV